MIMMILGLAAYVQSIHITMKTRALLGANSTVIGVEDSKKLTVTMIDDASPAKDGYFVTYNDGCSITGFVYNTTTSSTTPIVCSC